MEFRLLTTPELICNKLQLDHSFGPSVALPAAHTLVNSVTDLNVSRRTVLILDAEVAFAFWLGQALIQAGYDAFPAKSCEDATELLNELNVGIDLLVLNFRIGGTRDFAAALRRSQSHLKVLAAVGDEEERSPIFPEADAAKKKPSSAVDCSKIEWLRMIEGLLVA